MTDLSTSRVESRRRSRWISALVVLALSLPGLASADWEVVITLDEAYSITNADGGGSDDIYAKAFIVPSSAPQVSCNFKRFHQDGARSIAPDPAWACSASVTGSDPIVSLRLELWEHDGTLFTGSDDHFDIHPDPGQQDISLLVRPLTQEVTIDGVTTCGGGELVYSGGQGEDRARVTFSVSAGIVGAVDGDSDGDGLLDVWEVCGLPGLDLPGLGADPMHKDLFVEIDWMMEDDGIGGDHSHEPHLASLINAWEEMRVAPVTNPGVAGNSGIALYLDVGNLYAGYAADLDGIPGNELDIGDCTPGEDLDLDDDGTCESIDLDGDGFADIGNLGGGNRIPGGEVAVINFCPGLGSIRQSNFDDTNRKGKMRYALFAHRYGSSTNNSSGWACTDDFMVTLGVAAAGTDPTPSGLASRGSRRQHTGTFLHELGHTLGLGHGGHDGKNWKPNYLSIMNYYFQMGGVLYDLNGDGASDQLPGLDFDRDLIPDQQRFTFERGTDRIDVDEAAADEPDGAIAASDIGLDAFVVTRYGPFPSDAKGNPTSTSSACVNNCWLLPPPLIWHIPGYANAAIDWNRDGDPIDLDVNELDAAPGSPLDLNGNGAVDVLEGSYDYAVLQSGGLNPRGIGGGAAPGVDLQVDQTMRRTTLSVAPIADALAFSSSCSGQVETVDFETPAVGTVLSTEYLPLAFFPNASDLVPTVEGPTERGGAPTQSGTQSLVNAGPVGNYAPPVRILLPEPRRLVGLYMGVVSPGVNPGELATLEAFDIDGHSMGVVQAPLPDSSQGITGFIGMSAVFYDRLISGVELRYEGSALLRPRRVDDLMLCTTKTESSTPVDLPPPPAYGEPKVGVTVRAVKVEGYETSDGGETHVAYTESPLLGTGISVDGGPPQSTNFDVFVPEGTAVTFDAPQTVTTFRFVRWELEYNGAGSITFFDDDQRALPMTLLRSGTLTAVYVDDPDGDGFPDLAISDFSDNCPGLSNDQSDLDRDGMGNPCDADRDGDGLDNSVETGTGIFVSLSDTGTSPDLADTDGDGFTDSDEVSHESDPNSSASTPPQGTCNPWLINVFQGGVVLGTISPYSGSIGGAANYQYGLLPQSGSPINGPIPTAAQGQIFFYQGSDGLNLNMLFNAFGGGSSGSSGAVSWDLTVMGNLADTAVRQADDSSTNELLEGAVPDIFNGRWNWYERSDGGVIGELAGTSWSVHVQPLLYGGTEPLTTLRAYDASGAFVDLGLGTGATDGIVLAPSCQVTSVPVLSPIAVALLVAMLSSVGGALLFSRATERFDG